MLIQYIAISSSPLHVFYLCARTVCKQNDDFDNGIASLVENVQQHQNVHKKQYIKSCLANVISEIVKIKQSNNSWFYLYLGCLNQLFLL